MFHKLFEVVLNKSSFIPDQVKKDIFIQMFAQDIYVWTTQ